MLSLADWFWAIPDTMNRPGEFRLLWRSVDTCCRTSEVSFFLIYNNCCSVELISSIRCIYLQISVVDGKIKNGKIGRSLEIDFGIYTPSLLLISVKTESASCESMFSSLS